MNDIDHKGAWNKRTVAGFLDRSEWSVYRLHQTGQLRGFIDAGKLFFWPDVVREFLENKRAEYDKSEGANA